MTTTTRSIPSADGTPIGLRIIGTGPALVFIHGSIDTGESWTAVAEGLSDRFTSHLLDRRGRGLSGDSDQYSIDTEVADIAAVVDAVGPVVGLVGHSYGAICVLQALLAGVRPATAVVYDPPLPVHAPVAGDGLAHFSELLAAGDEDGALQFALIEFARATPDAVAMLRSSPSWTELVPLTPTWERELRAIDGVGPGVDRYASLDLPVVCLIGELANAHQTARTDALAAAVPGARVVTLPGQGQGPPAHRSAPDMLANVLRDVLTS